MTIDKRDNIIDAAKRAVCAAIDDAAENIAALCEAAETRHKNGEAKYALASIGATVKVFCGSDPSVAVVLRGADKWKAEATADAAPTPLIGEDGQ